MSRRKTNRLQANARPEHRPRPTHFSDPYYDFSKNSLDRLLETSDEELSWGHFQQILGPHLPAGTYEESVYFLPCAFDYILKHDGPGIEVIAPVVGFVSLNSQSLQRDGLLEEIRGRIRDCLCHWTRKFYVVHLDRTACRKRGFRVDHLDFVIGSSEVCETLNELVEFERHSDIVEEFAWAMSQHGGDVVKAAWFLELARVWIQPRGPFPDESPICNLFADETLLASAADLVCDNEFKMGWSPAYWTDTFTLLGLPVATRELARFNHE